MMNKGVLCLLAAGLLSACAGARESGKSYAVFEILKVRSAAEFDCRIEGYKYAESARFRVQVKDVKVNSQLPVEEAAEFLRERLKNADRIVLKNVLFRNYFRVEADVVIDGKDLGQELIALGLVSATKPAAPVQDKQDKQTQSKPTAYQKEHTRRYQSANTDKQIDSAPMPVRRQVVTLASLLDTPIDFSLVNEKTTLQEALQILSDSVRPRLPLVILWNDLKTNALVDKDIPIGIAGVGKVKLKQALELVLHSVSQRAQTKLLLSLQGNVMTIGTQKGLLVKSTTQSYSVQDIVMPPAVENVDNSRN